MRFFVECYGGALRDEPLSNGELPGPQIDYAVLAPHQLSIPVEPVEIFRQVVPSEFDDVVQAIARYSASGIAFMIRPWNAAADAVNIGVGTITWVYDIISNLSGAARAQRTEDNGRTVTVGSNAGSACYGLRPVRSLRSLTSVSCSDLSSLLDF